MSDTRQLTLVERYQRLMEISRDLASTLDLDTLLARIVTAASDLIDAEAASILLYDESSEQLFFQMSTSMAANPVMRGLAVPLDGSLAGWIVTHRAALSVPDTRADQRHYDVIDKTIQMSTRSLIGAPLIHKDKVVGVLEAINKRSGPFSPDDQDILSVLGAQAAVAIQNARLFTQSDLIAELVQELRTPLSSLCTLSYMLQRQEISPDQRHHLANTVTSEAQRLNDMSSAFLDLARLESGRTPFHLTLFDLPPLLEECAILFKLKAEEKRVKLSVELASNLPPIEADREKIKLVLIALIGNAIKYNRPGGGVTVTARGLTSSSPPEVLIEVKDSGLGIPADALPRLFQKFFRAHPPEKVGAGSGLGLVICKRIVESHRGRIEVASQVNTGTLVSVRMPVRQA